MEDIIVEEVEQAVFQDLYLKADSEDGLWKALEQAGLAYRAYDSWEEFSQFDENLNYIGKFEWRKTDSYDLDIIGVIYKQTGETVLEDGTIMPEVSMIDGFHANLRGSFTESQKALLPLIEAPATPMRVWA